ncbi:cytochrome P450 family protein [Actinomadura rupiterrae]|uniref:cytochrome P450 family protein n=1 Tax=Actinomadura rupiterrae TaxID=559627 RepID=UPI0020A243B9|nr:cytochrome P450 [Actinomadura rupiterrae]MCP2341517.1 cytochrome P450 [Actinomadura rupiterrae]
MTPVTPPAVHHLPADFTSMFDPYPLMERIRDAGRVQRVGKPGMGEFWVVTGYEDVLTVLTDARFSTRPPTGPRPGEPAEGAAGGERSVLEVSLLSTDPPDHTRLRRAVSRVFTVRRVATLRPRVKEITGLLLDEVAPTGHADLVADLAFPLTMAVICELLGVPLEDRDAFGRWSIALVLPPNPPEVLRSAEHAQRMLTGYFTDLIARKRAAPQDDLLSDLARPRPSAEGLSDRELLGMAILLVLAGHETTVNLVGTGIMTLLLHPDQLAVLRDDPDLLPAAVEELIRYTGPIGTGLARFATCDLDLAGTRIRRGDLVVTSLAAANRDPARYSAPHRFDIHRSQTPHVGFGHGIHFCLGAALARLEAEVAIGTALRRLPDLALAKPAEQLRWRTSSLRGLAELPVTFTPSGTTVR